MSRFLLTKIRLLILVSYFPCIENSYPCITDWKQLTAHNRKGYRIDEYPNFFNFVTLLERAMKQLKGFFFFSEVFLTFLSISSYVAHITVFSLLNLSLFKWGESALIWPGFLHLDHIKLDAFWLLVFLFLHLYFRWRSAWIL